MPHIPPGGQVGNGGECSQIFYGVLNFFCNFSKWGPSDLDLREFGKIELDSYRK